MTITTSGLAPAPVPVCYSSLVPEVILYSRQGCHLCEVVKASLERLTRRARFTWREVDIDQDEQLRQKYNEEVPVVFINGHKAFKYHMDENDFLKKLAAR